MASDPVSNVNVLDPTARNSASISPTNTLDNSTTSDPTLNPGMGSSPDLTQSVPGSSIDPSPAPITSPPPLIKPKSALFSQPSVLPDFNGDGKSDILWQYQTSDTANTYPNNNAVWLLNGTTATGFLLPTLDSPWDFSFADFNGDGKTDLFWNNAITGDNQIWLMDGANVTSTTSVQSQDKAFFPLIGNFKGDGKTDVFWRNSQTGENQLWLMNGSNIAAIKNLPSLDLNWSLSIGNFNGGANNDIFWHNQSTGGNQVWQMNGTSAARLNVTSSNGITLERFGSDWNYQIANFNGDRNSDIFWHNKQTGENVIWQMNGSVVTEQTSVQDPLLTPSPNSDFLIGDFNGDGKSDIFWRDQTTGENGIWLMDGTKTLAESVLPQLDPNWDLSIASFKGNGENDIFWYNKQTAETAVWLMDGTKVTEVSLPTQFSTAWQPTIGSFKGDGGKTTDIFWHNTDTGQNAVWLTNGTNGTNPIGYYLPTQPSTDWSVA